eukprot:112920_1
MADKTQTNLKYILYGDNKVGKTCILKTFAGEQFTSEYKSTINEEYKSRTVQMEEGLMTINIYDNAMNDNDVSGWIFVYDVSNRKSFDNLKKIIVNKLKNKNMKTIMVLANKSDSNERVVTFEDGQQFCFQHNIQLFYEISAKNDNGMLSQAIMRLTAKVINEQLKQIENQNNKHNYLTINNTIIISSLICVVLGVFYWRRYNKIHNN